MTIMLPHLQQYSKAGILGGGGGGSGGDSGGVECVWCVSERAVVAKKEETIKTGVNWASSSFYSSRDKSCRGPRSHGRKPILRPPQR